MDIETTTPAAKWALDCQGKQDLDGEIICFSSRYWPSRDYTPLGGAITKPCANCTIEIVINDEDGKRNTICIGAKEFEADTETQVKHDLEQWLRAEHKRIIQHVLELYKNNTPF